MNARLLFILLAVTIVLAIMPRFRRVGLGLSAALVLLIIYFSLHGANQPATSSAPLRPAPAATASSTAAPTAQVRDLTLTGNGAPWQLTGTAQNTSSTTIHVLALRIVRYDCPTAEAAQTECVLLWQGTRELRIDIAPAMTAKIDEHFYSRGDIERLRGVARDAITLVSVN